MNIECSVALNLLSMIYMLILLFNLRHKCKWDSLNRQYCQILTAVCLFLGLDILYLLFYEKTDPVSQVLLNTVKSLYFIVNSTIVWLWAKYVDYTLFGEQYKTKKHRVFYTIVLCINTLAVIFNFFTGFLFQISSAGTFVVHPAAMWVFTLLNYSSLLVALIITVHYRRLMKKNVFLTLLIFPLPPLFAEIIQIFFRSYSLICTYAVSALIVFQISQNNTIYTDELTGLANRKMLNETLRKWFSDPNGSMICGIMIDLDGLKTINDTYGHLSGDNALILMSDMIQAVKRSDLISVRYGGDEFILLWQSKNGCEISQIEQTLNEAKIQMNALKPERERIDFSTGTFCYANDGRLTADEFLQQLDLKMYESKNSKKQ